jgi:hypothetical protein
VTKKNLLYQSCGDTYQQRAIESELEGQVGPRRTPGAPRCIARNHGGVNSASSATTQPNDPWTSLPLLAP